MQANGYDVVPACVADAGKKASYRFVEFFTAHIRNANTIGFLLSVGYSRATKKFFGRQFHQQDVDYVARKLGYLPEVIDLECYEKSVQSRHRKMVLDYLGFREFNGEARQEVVKEIRTMVRSQMRPKNILNNHPWKWNRWHQNNNLLTQS